MTYQEAVDKLVMFWVGLIKDDEDLTELQIRKFKYKLKSGVLQQYSPNSEVGSFFYVEYDYYPDNLLGHACDYASISDTKFAYAKFSHIKKVDENIYEVEIYGRDIENQQFK